MYAIVSFHTDNYRPMTDHTWPNKVEYAQRHGYDYFCVETPQGQHYGPSGKIPTIKQYMDTHPDTEWIMWVDSDTLITNYTIKIEDLIDNDYHFIVSTDGNGINTGIFFIKNSPEMNKFIDYLLEVYVEFENKYQFMGEQESIAQSYEKPEWGHMMKLIPQHLINCHDCWPNGWEPGFSHDKFGNRSWWEAGDFIIHWPGSSLETRVNRQLPYYLPKVIK